MPLVFDGLTIPGIVKPWSPGAWDEQVQTHSSFGVEGEGHFYGGVTGRDLVIPMWVFDGYSNASSLFSKLGDISTKSRLGKIATITETSGVTASYPKCRMRPIVFGQDGALPPNSHIGWSYQIVLHFRQLQP